MIYATKAKAHVFEYHYEDLFSDELGDKADVTAVPEEQRAASTPTAETGDEGAKLSTEDDREARENHTLTETGQ